VGSAERSADDRYKHPGEDKYPGARHSPWPMTTPSPAWISSSQLAAMLHEGIDSKSFRIEKRGDSLAALPLLLCGAHAWALSSSNLAPTSSSLRIFFHARPCLQKPLLSLWRYARRSSASDPPVAFGLEEGDPAPPAPSRVFLDQP